jgi:hypothetical protein
MKASGYVADFDSASAMLRALGRYLHRKDFPVLGTKPAGMVPALKPLAAAINASAPRTSPAGWCVSIRSAPTPPR